MAQLTVERMVLPVANLLYGLENMEVVMIIRTKITKRDFEQFNAYTVKKLLKPGFRWSFLRNISIWFLTAFIFTSLFQHIFNGKSSINLPTVFTTAIPFMLIIFIGYIERRRVAKCYKINENGIMLGDKEFEISDKGIKEEHLYGGNFYKWNAVESIEEHNGAIYIFVDKILALIFPSSAFEDAKLKREFLELVNSMHCKFIQPTTDVSPG
jgi:hypothetical protein